MSDNTPNTSDNVHISIDLATCERIIYNIFQSTIANREPINTGSATYSLMLQIINYVPSCHRKTMISQAIRMMGRREHERRTYLSLLKDWQHVWAEMSKDAGREVTELIAEEEARLQAMVCAQVAESALSGQESTRRLKRKASTDLAAETSQTEGETRRPRKLVILARKETAERDGLRDPERHRKRREAETRFRLAFPGRDNRAVAGSPPESFRRRARELAVAAAIEEHDKAPTSTAPSVAAPTPMPTMFPRVNMQRRPAPTEEQVRAFLENLSLQDVTAVQEPNNGESSRAGGIAGVRRIVTDEEVREFMQKLSLEEER